MAVSDIDDVLKRIKEEHDTISTIGAEGWGKVLDPNGNPIDRHNLTTFKEFIKHDPVMIDFADKMVAKLEKLLDSWIGFRDTRELEVKGCVPYEDCRSISPQFTCRHLVIQEGREIRCKIGRMSKGKVEG